MGKSAPLRLAGVGLAAVLGLAGCTRLSPEMQVVADAAEAMGGAERLQAVQSLTMEGSGRDLAVGGSVTPEAPPNVNLVADYRRSLDVTSPRMRTRQTRTAQYRFANSLVVRQDQGVDGDVAYNVPAADAGQAPAPQRASANAARDRRAERLRHPLVLVRAALDPAAKVTNLRTEDNQPHVDVTLPSGEVVTLGVDPATKLPSHASVRAYDPNWGDVVIEVTVLELPGRGRPAAACHDRHETGPVDDQRADAQQPDPGRRRGGPGGARGREGGRGPDAAGARRARRGGRERASGGWRVPAIGASRSSSTTTSPLFEVPLDEARTKAVIEKARTLRPGKPVTHAVVTHHHLDHAGGYQDRSGRGADDHHAADLRAVLQGVRRPAPHAAAGRAGPSAQSRRCSSWWTTSLELKDGTNTVVLYNVETSHMKAALFAWVPRDRTLIQADLFDDGWQQQPWGDTFLEAIAARKLAVVKHVPIHGPIQTHAEVLKTLKETPKSPPGGWPFE